MDTDFIADCPVSTVRSNQQSPRIVRLALRAVVLRTLIEMASVAQSTPAAICYEMIESGAAEFNLAKITRTYLIPSGAGARATRVSKTADDSRRKIEPEQVQTLLFLHESEKLGVAALAERFGISAHHVGHILQRRKATNSTADSREE